MLTQEQKAEMKSGIESISLDLPPHGIWQEFKPHLTPKLATYYEAYWLGVKISLNAFCLDFPEPNFSYLEAPLEKLIRVASHYYKIAFLMICQSEQKFLRPEVESWGTDYIFDQKFFLSRLMFEDCWQYLEMLQHAVISGKYEFLSGQDWLDGFHSGVKYLRGEMSKNVCNKNAQRLLDKEKRINNSLNYNTQNPDYYKCNILCLKIWKKHQKEIPAYNSWVEALDEFRTMFTKKDSPAFGMLKKTVFIYNFNDLLEAHSYPGRGKKKKKGFS